MFQLTEKRPIYHFTLKHWLGLIIAVCSSDSTIWLFWQRQDTRMYQQTPAPNKSQTIHFNTPSKQQRTGDTHTHTNRNKPGRGAALRTWSSDMSKFHSTSVWGAERERAAAGPAPLTTLGSRGETAKKTHSRVWNTAAGISRRTQIYIYILKKKKSHIRGMSCDQ